MNQKGRFDELTTHIQALRRYAYGLCRNRHESEDLVQECLSRAIAAADSWRPDVSLRPWLFRILHNVYVSQQRRAQVRGPVLDVADEDGAMEGNQLSSLDLRDVFAAMERLPADQREAVMLMAVEDLSYREAAEVLGVPLGTFMSRLGRGRKALRAQMGDQSPRHLRIVGGDE